MSIDCTLTVAVGPPVTFELQVVNGGDRPLSLAFRDAGKADFAVYEGDREVWRWSEGRMYAQVRQRVELAPGEQIAFEGEWEEPVPGEYEAVGTLRAANHDCEARAPLSV